MSRESLPPAFTRPAQVEVEPTRAAADVPLASNPRPVRWPHTNATDRIDRAAARDASVEAEHALAVAEAYAQGRAQGRAETQALRDELAVLCRAVQVQQRRTFDRLGVAVVDAALVVIEAWLEGCDRDRRARLVPVVKRWVHEVGRDVVAVAQVSAGDVDALRAVVGELPIEICVEPTLPPGDVRLRGERMAIELRWSERLGELRGELVTAMAELAFDPGSGEDAGASASSESDAESESDAVSESDAESEVGARSFIGDGPSPPRSEA